MIAEFVDIFLHLDKHLSVVIETYGTWTYLILFLIIFCETGFVVTPFLPGDSLLFAAGTFSALGVLDPGFLFVLLGSAAVMGNMVNYQIGLFIGPRVFYSDNVRLFKREHLLRTQRFYEKYGAMAIVIARFLPIIRTFVPFLAGIGRMHYMRFTLYNFVGSVAWISLFVFGGYFFGNIPVIKENFTLVILGIIFVSILPTFIGIMRHRRRRGD